MTPQEIDNKIEYYWMKVLECTRNEDHKSLGRYYFALKALYEKRDSITILV